MLNHLFTLLLALSFMPDAHAVQEPSIVAPLEGRSGQLKPDSSAQVEDIGFYEDLQRSPHKFEATHVKNIISFSINESSGQFLKTSFQATVVYRLYFILKDKPYQEDSLTENQTLIVNYDTTQGKAFNARNSFVFENAVSVRVKIVSVATNASGWDPLPSLKLTNELQINRIYIFDCEENKVAQIGFTPPATDDADDLKVWWQAADGADEYDLEWAYIDASAYDDNVYGGPGTADFEKNVFRNNAARVTLNNTTLYYYIPLLYDNNGWLIFRVRSVQVNPDGQRREANWSSSNAYQFTPGHQPQLNWQANTSFAEEGKRKSVVQYFDGSLHNRQTVTKDNTEHTTVVAETMYDYQGRPVIQVLPAPTINTLILYTPHFNSFLNSGAYYKDNYDRILPGSDYCDGAAPALDPARSGAAQYYSPQNPEKDQGNNKLIPDANGFPYAETKYTKDNTGRIAAQSGVGFDHRLASGHETKYYYGNPDQVELDALFGTETGDASHYFKNMVRDANGQYSVSYTDMHGRTIATALAGDLPADSKLDYLPSKQDSYLTKTLTDASNNIVKGIVVESSKGLLVPKTGNHVFTYSLLPDTTSIANCNNADICYTCTYTIEITLADDCGNKQFGGKPFVFNDIVGNINTNCTNLPALFTKTFSKTLEEGAYTVTKKLTIRDEALQYYQELFANSNLCKTVTDFVEEQKQMFLNSTQHCATPCYTCQQQLGVSQQDYIDRFITDNGLNTNLASDRELALTAYNKLYQQCQELCGTAKQDNYLHTLRSLMLQDVTPPHGQYANINDYTGEGNFKEYYANGIFGAISQGNSNHRYTIASLNYKNTDGTPAMVSLLRNGSWVTVKPQKLTLTEFVENFQPSWAEALADNLHPERFQYNILNTTAITNNQVAVGNENYDWEMDFISTETFAQAQQKGYLNPTANAGFINRHLTAFPINSANADPFFTRHPQLRSQMNALMRHVAAGGVYTADIWSAACMAGFCSDANDLVCMQKQLSDPFSTSGCAADLDVAWQAFRAIYKSKKDELILTMVKSNSGNAPVMEGLKYHSYFTDALTTIKGGTGINDINSKAEADAALQRFYLNQTTCQSYAQIWWQKLTPCDIEKLTPYKTQFLSDLVTVCQKGTDETHVMGASSIAPQAANAYRDFDEVIAHYVQLYNSAHPGSAIGLLDCNGSLLNFPASYTTPQVIANKTIISKPEPCECERITNLYTTYLQEHADNDFSSYIQRRLHTTISNGALDTLMSLCDGAIDCKFIATPIVLPPSLQCGMGDVCVPCLAVKQGFDSFSIAYPGIAPHMEETTAEQQKVNQLFAHHMNRRFGFAKQAQEYITFMDSCGKGVMAACDSLAEIRETFQKYRYQIQYDNDGNDTTSWVVDFGGSTNNTGASHKEIFHDGIAQYPYTVSGSQHVDYDYMFRKDSVCLNNNFKIEFRIKNSVQDSVLRYAQELLWLYGDNGYHHLIFRPVNNYWNCFCSFQSPNAPDTCTCSLNNFVRRFDDWRTVKIIVKDNKFNVYLDSIFIQSLDYSYAGAFNKLYGFSIVLSVKDSIPGGIDWIKLYDSTGTIIYNEDFDDPAHFAHISEKEPCSVQECQSSFTNHYNQQKGTFLTYDQIDSLYLKTCGSHLDVCGVGSPQKDSLLSVLAAFKENYHSINNDGIDTGLSGVQWITGGYSAYTDSLMTSSDLPAIADTGVLHMPTGSDPLYYAFMGYINLNGICIENEYSVEARIKNPTPASQGGDVVMSANTHSINTDSSDIDEDFTVDFVPNRPNASFYRLRGVRYYDTSFSYKDFQDWRTIKMSVKTDSLRVYYEGNLIFRRPRDGRSFIDRIDPFLSFQQGINAQLDWIKFYGTNDELMLFEDFNDTAHLASHTEKYMCAAVDCKTKFSRYFNNLYNHQYTFIQIDSLYAANGIALHVCADTTPPTSYHPNLLLCGTTQPTIISIEDHNEAPCADSLNFAISRGYERYSVYSDSLRGEFTKTFIAKCLKAAQQESFTVKQPVSEYHYTLYFYDQAGSLIKTVPPNGVHPNYDAVWLQSVKDARDNNTMLVPSHELVTQYRYNTLNQVVQQHTPDAGYSNFWYDRLGRLAVSQNAKQSILLSVGGEPPAMRYSYTLYDYLSRITEVGEISNAAGVMTNAISRSPAQLQKWFSNNSARRQQITATFYDLPAKESYLQKDLSPYILQQNHLRNRISFSVLAEAGDLINYDYAVFYNYDIHGNVDTLLQDYGETGLLARHGNRYKRITHQYDLISGKINSLSYQPRLYDPVTAQWIIQPDAFYHHYSYDAENRLTDVYASADETHWDHDAHYQYYKHGPLSRAVIGENQVQGIDYAYTLQGWLKGVNGTTAEEGQVARDAYNFSLHYHANDYSAINAPGAYSGLSTKLEILNAYKPLFNGNISSMAVDIDRLGTPLLYNYRYDQLNRLTAMDAYKGNASDKNIWDNGLSITQDYKESIGYDASGNILGYARNGWDAALPMDKLTYHYQPGNNKLDHVKDIVPAANYVEDIDDQQPGNYAYDEIGNLIQDNAEGISKIEWTVYGKLKSIVKTNAEKIVYTYDASGNRISKEVNTSGATLTTMYVRDASGNTMAVYAVNSSGNRLFLNEQHLYGSNRLGIFLPGRDLSAIPPLPVNMGYGNSGSLIIFERGKKLFELSNHLGNVLATVSDKKAAHDAGNGTIDYYDADVVSAQDYYPFGMTMPGRKFDSGKYRYGFNGKENDNEVKGEGNQQDYGMRISDTRLGRFLSVDPLTKDFAELTPYQFANNSPIENSDLDGKESISETQHGLARKFDVLIQTKAAFQNAYEQKVRHFTVASNSPQIPSPPFLKSAPNFSPVEKTNLEVLFNITLQNEGYNYDLTKKAGTKLMDNKTYQNFSNNIALPVLEIASMADGIGEIKALFKGTSFVFKSFKRTSQILEGVSSTINEVTARRVLIGSSEKIAVIGRDMKRVNAFAKDIGAETWTGYDPLLSESRNILNNAKWAKEIKEKGYTVFDVGLDERSILQHSGNKGSYYKVETNIIFGDK